MITEEMLIKNLNDGDKEWTFLDGSVRSAVILDTVAIGRGTYKPGWRWSEHVGKQTGKEPQAHVGYVISGQMIVKGVGGREVTVGPGDAFELGPGHDAWVVGNEPCIALDFEYLSIS